MTDFDAPDHWSSPDGCHSECPACAEERPAYRRPFSVLLLYPDYIAETFGTDNYYDHVEARTPQAAVIKAQKRAAKTNGFDTKTACDMVPLLVLSGHHYGLDYT